MVQIIAASLEINQKCKTKNIQKYRSKYRNLKFQGMHMFIHFSCYRQNLEPKSKSPMKNKKTVASLFTLMRQSTYCFDQTKTKIIFPQFFNDATVMVTWFMEYCHGSVRCFNQFQFYLSRLAIPKSI